MDQPQAVTLRADIPGPDQASTSLTTPRSTQVTMGAPSNTSLIQDADGFTILGGQFTSAAGDVTVHNYYPDPERGLASISPLNLIDGTFSESEIYCTQLLHQKRGFPLHVPGVQQTLPEEYRKRGVAIGDVGRITPEGSFNFFFNIYLPADHPIHNRNVPEDFFPLPLYDTLDLYDQSYLAGHHVSTPILPDGDFVFRCHSPQGAVLALPQGSHLQKLRNLESVRTYAATHAESWFRYVNGPRGRGLDGSFVPETFQLTFMLYSGASGYRWRGNLAQRKYHDPSPMQEPYWNQTAFIHGLSISLGTGVWARMFETVQIREIANTESRLGGGGSNSSSLSHGSSLLSRILGFFGGGGNEEQSRRHITLSDFPAISQAPQATVVMSHDWGWASPD
ncbi:hypothetical protein B0H14DRAFT_3146523 [Mycena olivaceomarginata]|nr:hypothetical protein B0H14DRAFT_3146523 [Mycena olivaceomarginata]